MKVTGAGRQLDKNVMAASVAEEKKVAEAAQTSFREHISREDVKCREGHISELLEKINKQGKKLSKKVDIKELKIYKKMVSDFLEEAVNNSHKFSKENYLDKRGRHRVYAVIRKINEQMDLLTSEVLKEQKDNLAILQRIDDIRGLLLDLMI